MRLRSKSLFILFSLAVGIVPLFAANLKHLDLTLSYRNSYDSNLMRYSQRDIDRFLDRTEPHTSQIKTLDDIRTDIKLSGGYSLFLKPKIETRFITTVNFAHHLQNPVKNFGWLSLTGRQDITRRITASVNYFFEPEYYLRYYRDVHTGQRQKCTFALSQWKGDISYRPIKMFEFGMYGKTKKYAYNEFFTEYDSDLIEAGGEVIFRTGPWRIAGGYALAMNDNIGFNPFDITGSDSSQEDSDEGNGDYEEDNYSLSVRYSFKFMQKNARLLFESTLADRYYTTDRSYTMDPIHSGRRDLVVGYALSGRLYFSRLLNIELGAEYGQRSTRASSELASAVKDYDRWAGWAELSFKIK